MATIGKWVCIEPFADQVMSSVDPESLRKLAIMAVEWCVENRRGCTFIGLADMVEEFLAHKLEEAGHHVFYEFEDWWTEDELNGIF